MKKLLKVSAMAVASLAVAAAIFTACQDEHIKTNDASGKGAAVKATIDIGLPSTCGGTDTVDAAGNVFINRNLHLTDSNTYVLHNIVRITAGHTITIDPGVTILGAKIGTTSCDIVPATLVIEQGAQIDADGETAATPIIFTSLQTNKVPGDWAGIILLGDAPVCAGSNLAIEGLPTPNNTGLYGGSDATDNSGIMRYVVIEYAGNILGDPATSSNESNGLTLGGIGSGTTLSYIQVHRGFDDGFEFFGGTVNADHLVASLNADDDFDTDFGYSGKIQFAVSIRQPNEQDAEDKLSNEDPTNVLAGTETNGDNDNCSNTNTFTIAQFSNFTFIGPYQNDCADSLNAAYPSRFSAGVNARDLSHQDLFNSVILGWDVGVRLSNDAAVAAYFNTSSSSLSLTSIDIRNTTIVVPNQGVKAATRTDIGGGNWDATFLTSGLNNAILTANSCTANPLPTIQTMSEAAGLQTSAWNAVDGTQPDLRPAAGSPLVGSASFTGLTGFTTVDYRGAFGTTDNWLTSWTSWD